MGLIDVLDDGPLRRMLREGRGEVTVSDLEDKFGEEAVNRGLSYMESLSEADKNYRKSGDADKYAERLAGAYTDGEYEGTDRLEEAKNNWRAETEKRGLNLGDSDDS